MFEKEAEEAGNEKIKGNYQFARCARKSYKDGFKDGAEFGYNKAHEQLINPELIQAKKIIRNCLNLWNNVMTEETVRALIKEAKQFIKEVEK